MDLILYHGTDNPNLTIKQHVRSRYGIIAFFGTPNPVLAKKYARQRSCFGTGYLYQFKVQKPTKTIDFSQQNTYSTAFRNLIYKLAHSGIDAVYIKNALDYPNYKETDRFALNDIVVIFNPHLISNLERIN